MYFLGEVFVKSNNYIVEVRFTPKLWQSEKLVYFTSSPCELDNKLVNNFLHSTR